MTGHRVVSRGDVVPTDIEHKCEEHFAGEELEQKYNCMVYHFARNDGYFWARTYTDEISMVSVYGPFEGQDATNQILSPQDEGMLSYLKRRFRKIQMLENDRYAKVWSEGQLPIVAPSRRRRSSPP